MIRRRGLVLGAGGFLGAAWTLGALTAIEQATEWDARDAELVVGTSAGSVLAALLRVGVPVRGLYDAHRGDAVAAELAALPGEPPTVPLPDADLAAVDLDLTRPDLAPVELTRPDLVPVDLTAEPCRPGLPAFGIGSVPLVARYARNPLHLSPAALCAALLPRGRRPLTRIGQLVRDAGPCPGWPDGTWLVAMNYHTGERVAFGQLDSPRPPIADAVMASCAVPAWYAPVRIDGFPYIDGGVCSPFNADLLAGADLDEIYVLAPMACAELDHPRDPRVWLERLWRRAVNRRLHREVTLLRAAGKKVVVLAPDARDLVAMGANMMDAARQSEVMRVARDGIAHRLAHPAAHGGRARGRDGAAVGTGGIADPAGAAA